MMAMRLENSFRSRWLRCGAMAAFIVGQSLSNLEAADIDVTTLNDSGAGSFRQGLSVANSGDRLVFDSLTSGSTLANGASLIFNNAVSLLNNSASSISLTDPHNYSIAAPLTINWGGTLNLNGNLSNGGSAGSLIVNGNGTVALSGNNTFSGGTMFEGGTLQLLSNSALGSGNLTVHSLGSTTTLGLADGVQVSNNIQLQTGLVINSATGTTSTISGVISESGGSNGLNKTGGGTLILSGTNTFSGGVYVSNDSTIRVENNAALGTGTVTTAGGLTLDLANGVNVGNHFSLQNNFVANVSSGTATISGIIGDNVGNSLTKTGSGTLILGGNDTYTGLTTINSGGLQVGGSITSDVLVANSTSMLSGAGSVGSITNNGIVQPGNSGIGNLTVNGNFTQNSGGTTQILVSPAGNTPGVDNGHLSISGHANLAGTLNIETVGGGSFTTGTQYTILNANSGVNGHYAVVTDNLSLYGINVTYNPNDVVIQLQQTGSLANSATTGNQSAVANALQNISLSSSGSLFTMINTLGSETASQQRQSYNQLSGDQFGDTQTLALQTGDVFQQRILNRVVTSGIFIEGAPSGSSYNDNVRGQSPDLSKGGWIQGYGMSGSLSGDNNGAGVSYSQGGAVYGMDLASDETGMFGVAMGNSYVGFHDGFGGGGQLTSYQVGLYGLKQNDQAYIFGSANYAYDNFGSNRNVTIGGVNQTLTGNFLGNQFGANLETGLKFERKWFQIQPLMGLQYLYLAQQGFDETGGSAALNVSAAQASSLRSNLGVRVLSRQFVGPRGAVWTPYLQTKWVAELLDNDRIINASFNGSPVGGTFTASGTSIGTNYALITKGFQVQFNDQWSMFFSADLFLGTLIRTETGTLGLCYLW